MFAPSDGGSHGGAGECVPIAPPTASAGSRKWARPIPQAPRRETSRRLQRGAIERARELETAAGRRYVRRLVRGGWGPSSQHPEPTKECKRRINVVDGRNLRSRALQRGVTLDLFWRELTAGRLKLHEQRLAGADDQQVGTARPD